MDPKELEEFLKTAEGKEFFDKTFQAYAKEQGLLTKEDVKGLADNKQRILDRLHREKEKSVAIPENVQKLLDILSENDILDSEELESFLVSKGEPAQTNLDADKKYKRLEKKFDDLTAERDTANKTAGVERKARIDFQREAILTKALTESKVKPQLFKAAFAMFDKEIIAEDNEDGSISFISSDELGLPISKHIIEWSKTDDAKDFIEQPKNSGSGGQIGNGNGKGILMMSEYDKMSPQDQEKAAMDPNITLKD